MMLGIDHGDRMILRSSSWEGNESGRPATLRKQDGGEEDLPGQPCQETRSEAAIRSNCRIIGVSDRTRLIRR